MHMVQLFKRVDRVIQSLGADCSVWISHSSAAFLLFALVRKRLIADSPLVPLPPRPPFPSQTREPEPVTFST